MPTYKRIDGDYVITTLNTEDTVLLDTSLVTISGNLDVLGNVTYIESKELIVDDPFITVAGNNSGTGNAALFPNQGLVTQTGANTFAGIRFNNNTNEWQISASVDANGAPISAYASIGTANASAPGGSINDIQFKTGAVTFGGSSDFSFDSANSKVTLDGHMVFANLGAAPSAVANSVGVYSGAEGSGGTGLYVKSTAVEDELVSKTKAIVFGIIF